MKTYLCEVKVSQYLVVIGVNKRDAESNVKLYIDEGWGEAINQEYEPSITIKCRVIK